MKAKMKKVFKDWVMTSESGSALYSVSAEGDRLTVRYGTFGDWVARIVLKGEEAQIILQDRTISAEVTHLPYAHAPLPDKIISAAFTLDGMPVSIVREGCRWHITRKDQDVGEIVSGMLSVTMDLSDTAEGLAGILLGLYAAVDRMEKADIV